jgi:carbon starvation protein
VARCCPTSTPGSILVMGVKDPLGGIYTLFPLFGIANQLLAAIALTVVFTILMKQGKFRWAWIPGVPLMWDLIVTLTASYQKIFSDVPAIGYFANHDKFVAAKAAGEVIAPAQTMADMDKVSRNTMIQGSLSILYPQLVIIVVLVALKVCVDALRRGGLPTTEAEDVPSQIFAPRSFLPTPAEKEVLEEWRAAGLDPSPQGAGH